MNNPKKVNPIATKPRTALVTGAHKKNGPAGDRHLSIFRPTTINAVGINVYSGGWYLNSQKMEDSFNDSLIELKAS